MFSGFLAHTEQTNNANNDVSLHTILKTPTQRTELVLLVALCTDAQRRNLLRTFTAAATIPLDKRPRKSSKEESLVSFEGSKSNVDPEIERLLREREQELSTPKLQGLRRAAVAYFDGWQVNVLRRLGEVLNVRSELIRQARRERTAAGAAATAGGKEKDRDGRYRPVETSLKALKESDKTLILHSLLLLLLSLEHYTAHSRVLLLHLASSLDLSSTVLSSHEETVARGLLAAASTMSADDATRKAAASSSADRRWKVGLATIAGAALIGVTGGLAAPLLAAGLGTVMGGLGLGATAVSGLLGTLAGSSVLIGGLFGAYGGRMTGRIMEKYAKEVDDFKFLPVRGTDLLQEKQDHKLRVAIGISGWLNEESDIYEPWRAISPTSIEPFALRWELDSLLDLGAALIKLAQSYAWDIAKYEIIRHTLLGALYAGLWPLGLLKCAGIVDNPFSIAKARADKAGKVLAQALMDKVQGERSVTLVGYSLGARVVYSCLKSLAEHNAFGIVEQAIFMGTPAPADSMDWTQVRSVVSGRIVNVYSSDDYVLGFLYRSSSIQLGIAGLQPIENVFGIENVDVSELVKGHVQYRRVVGQILMQASFGELDANEVLREIEAGESKEALDLVSASSKVPSKEFGNARAKNTQTPTSASLIDFDDDIPTPKEIKPPSNPIAAQKAVEKNGKVKVEMQATTSVETLKLVDGTAKLRLHSEVRKTPHLGGLNDDSDIESEDGRIKMVDATTKPSLHSDFLEIPRPEDEKYESDIESEDGRIKMVDLDPMPEPDYYYTPPPMDVSNHSRRTW